MSEFKDMCLITDMIKELKKMNCSQDYKTEAREITKAIMYKSKGHLNPNEVRRIVESAYWD